MNVPLTEFGVAEAEDAAVRSVDDGRDDVAENAAGHVTLSGQS